VITSKPRLHGVQQFITFKMRL